MGAAGALSPFCKRGQLHLLPDGKRGYHAPAARTKAAGLRFYTAFLYCVAKVVNAHDEFKLSYRWQEDKLILWDEVVPSHIVFHEDSETFTRICSAWDTDFTVFYNACEQDLAAGKALRGIQRAGGAGKTSSTFPVSHGSITPP